MESCTKNASPKNPESHLMRIKESHVTNENEKCDFLGLFYDLISK